MECKAVITTERIIECATINPTRGLPGFYDLWIDADTRYVVNGQIIIEVIPNDTYICDHYKGLLKSIAR